VVTVDLLLDAATLSAVAALFLWLFIAQPSRSDLESLDEALGLVLGDLRDRLNALDDLVDLLPALVPGVTLVNENPLTKILEFIQSLREAGAGSSSAAPLQDDSGRFIHGGEREKDSEAEESTPPSESD